MPVASATAGPAATDDSAATRQPEAKEKPRTTLAATAVDAKVAVRSEPDGKVMESLQNPTATGVPLTFMVLSARDGWVVRRSAMDAYGWPTKTSSSSQDCSRGALRS